MQGNVYIHFVEYLGMQAATVVRPGPGVTVKESEPVVIITVRPDPGSFQSHNFGLSAAQAERLWEDLGSMLGWSAVFLMLALLPLAATGCSAKVEVERQNWNNTSSQARSGEKERTAVQLQLLHGQPQKAAIPQPSERKSGTVDQGRVDVIVIDPGNASSAQVKAADKPSRETEKRSDRTGLNTTIGWPSHYLEHGLLAFGGSLVVWMLVGWAMWIVLACAFCTDKPDDPMLPIIVTVALLIAAAVILQFLPATDSGLQFIPLPPWNYSGVVPVCLSIFSWIAIVIAALAVMTGRTDAPAAFSAAMLASLGCNLLLSAFVG